MRTLNLIFSSSLILLIVANLAQAPNARCDIVSLTGSLVQDALSESMPTAFAPDDIDTSAVLGDFSVRWVGTPIPGVSFRLEPNSLQWVRVQEVLVVPRARLWLHVENASSGSIQSGNFAQPISADISTAKEASALVPVALVSGAGNPMEITVIRGGTVLKGRVEIRYSSTDPKRASVGIDSSCSRFGFSVEASNFPSDQRMYLGCRLVVSEGENYRTSSLDVYVFWDAPGSRSNREISINGVPTAAVRPSLWLLSLQSAPGKATLEENGRSVTIHYSIPDRLHFGSVGMGLGPYSHQYSDPATSVSEVAPLLTVYGSYAFSDTTRLIGFDATTISDQWVTDFGLYLTNELARVLDNRLAVHILLGGHAIGFSSGGQYYLKLGAPQGIDVVFADAFQRNRNLSLGGYVFPSVSGTSYYNFWLRWGSPSVFAEINYILWTEQLSSQEVFSRSIGLSIGFPVVRFL